MIDHGDAARRVVMVTGAGTGVGRATALLLARRGYDVALGYRSSAAGVAAVEAECRALGAATYVHQLDVAVDAECRAFAAGTLDRFGRIDGLVNNAATTRFVSQKDLDAQSAEDFHTLFGVNAVGAYQLTRAAAPALAEASGAVVNVSSVTGVTGVGSSIAYAVSKAALNMMTITLARALAPVRVNAVLPGMIDTGWVADRLGADVAIKARATMEGKAALGRITSPEEVADLILWLLEAPSMTGELMRIDGGATLGR